jgi:hypothetical protein
MLRLLLVCLIGAWAMWLAMLAAAGFLKGDPRRILCHRKTICASLRAESWEGGNTSFGHVKRNWVTSSYYVHYFYPNRE